MVVGLAYKNMKRYNILLIGAGQLGSRHLQGLAKSKLHFDIHITDISSQSLNIAEERFNEANLLKESLIVSKSNSIEDLPSQHFDLVIIATNADIRFAITKKLLSLNTVSNIIFEKVAFQSEPQFNEIISLLKKHSVMSWVNCARRHFSGYRNLFNLLKGVEDIKFSLAGDEWGLACNSVHFIDLFAFLTSNANYKITKTNLIPQIFESKRKGFIEFFGEYEGVGINGCSFSITCKLKQENITVQPSSIELDYGNFRILIEESSNRILFFEKNNQVPFREEQLGIIYQSNLTNLQAEQILLEGYSSLPTLQDSFEIHKPFLKMIKSHYEQLVGYSVDLVPIT